MPIELFGLFFNGTFPEQVDHDNRVRNDNRIENLKSANNTTNQHNSGKRLDNTSGFIGVTQKGDKWSARISAYGKRINLGLFDTKEEAALSYKVAKNLYH